MEAEGSNKQLLLRVRYLEDQLVKVGYGDSGRVELVIVGGVLLYVLYYRSTVPTLTYSNTTHHHSNWYNSYR